MIPGVCFISFKLIPPTPQETCHCILLWYTNNTITICKAGLIKECFESCCRPHSSKLVLSFSWVRDNQKHKITIGKIKWSENNQDLRHQHHWRQHPGYRCLHRLFHWWSLCMGSGQRVGSSHSWTLRCWLWLWPSQMGRLYHRHALSAEKLKKILFTTYIYMYIP